MQCSTSSRGAVIASQVPTVVLAANLVPVRVTSCRRVAATTAAACSISARKCIHGHTSRVARGVACRADPPAIGPHGHTETLDELLDRRIRESAQVEERVAHVSSLAELKTRLRAAGDKLVLLEVQQEGVCEAGLDMPEPEHHWKLDAEAATRKRLEACASIKHAFMRTARECPSVVFLAYGVEGDGAPEEKEMLDALGVSVVPTLQFYKQGTLLWDIQGYPSMEADLGQGALFFGDAAAGGEAASEHVPDLNTKADVEKFLYQSDPKELTVLYVATACTPCVRVFPAVLALARNFVGQVSFGRLLGDEHPQAAQLLQQLGIVEVPTFIFFRGGRELGRLVSSHRGDLVGKVLQYQQEAGIAPPKPIKPAAKPPAPAPAPARSAAPPAAAPPPPAPAPKLTPAQGPPARGAEVEQRQAVNAGSSKWRVLAQ